jgi:hypothetical protein
LQYSKEYGVATISSLITINGGAIIALLSFLAAGLSEGVLAAADVRTFLVNAFTCFGLALILSVVAGALGYMNFQAHVVGSPGPSGLSKFVRDGDVSSVKPEIKTIIYTARGAAFLVAVSVCLFIWGAWCAVRALEVVTLK